MAVKVYTAPGCAFCIIIENFLKRNNIKFKEIDISKDVKSKEEIKVNINCETNIKGVYAAGDVASTSWKQAIIAAAQGVTAAFSAYNYLAKKN